MLNCLKMLLNIIYRLKILYQGASETELALMREGLVACSARGQNWGVSSNFQALVHNGVQPQAQVQNFLYYPYFLLLARFSAFQVEPLLPAGWLYRETVNTGVSMCILSDQVIFKLAPDFLTTFISISGLPLPIVQDCYRFHGR